MLCLPVIFLVQGAVSSGSSTGIVENIASALNSGNARELAKYFCPTVEIILPGSDGNFSKAQAEMIMKDFFSKSVPLSFSVNRKGNSTGGAQFVIGAYKSKTEVLNVYILLKPTGDQLLIQQLHFEAD